MTDRGPRRLGGQPRPLAFEDLERRVVCSANATERPWSHAVETRALPGPTAHSLSQRRMGPKASGASLLANLAYTDPSLPPQVLDVYRPSGQAPPGGWPVVLAIHGGGWRRFNKEEYASKIAPPLLSQGFAVVAPNYTLSSHGSPSWPAPFLELQQAVRWVHGNAPSLGLDATRVAAMGESAGGHLALMLGTDPAGPDTRVQAVVDFFGPADLTSLRAESPGARVAIDQLLGPAVSDPSALADASPLSHVTPDDAPVLIVQGTADTLVPPEQSRTLAAALNAAHVPNTLILVPGAIHGFGIETGGRSFLPSIRNFLDRFLTTSP